MKHYRLLLLLSLLITILIDCKRIPEVRFVEPQPVNKKDLHSIPKIFLGKYLNISDSSILTIDSKLILQEWTGFSRISKKEMKEELDTVYQNDVKVQLGDNWTMTVKIEGDSASLTTYGLDTLFAFSDNQLLRTYKGYLFLNYKSNDDTWRVKTLKYENNLLDFNLLIDVNQIDSLKEVTNIVTVIDTSSNRIDHYDLSPKRKDLKEILKRENSTNRFIRL